MTLWRTRPLDEPRLRRYPRRLLLAVAGAVVFYHLISVAFSYGFTHAARPVVPSPELGAGYEDVTFTTSDGLELSGWYVPSKTAPR